MRQARTLNRSPRLPGLYARTALAAIPGAGRLPFLPGHGDVVPATELRLAGVRANLPALAEYRQVCGFDSGGELPSTYPHVLAFPMHLALISEARFPCTPAGLVHTESTIRQHRPISPGGDPGAAGPRGRPDSSSPWQDVRTADGGVRGRTAGVGVLQHDASAHPERAEPGRVQE